ncbi:type II secretion system F family protein [Aeromicrobium sp. Root344]|uniref:type II secretion system F family protein n=1 Tax=Aeromicrobium sp. Root344 TaxID=1736521 RepID=UPI000AD76285|nr:type II secretion system F family protein [Aeromicrobium sp. Root344]
MLILTGGVCVLLAIAALAYALLAPPVSRVPASRRTFGGTDQKTGLNFSSDQLVERVDDLLRRSSWTPFGAKELELAGLRITPGNVVVLVAAVAASVLSVVTLLTGSFWLGLALALLVPVGAKVYLFILTDRRRTLFTKQLDDTVQMIASALRAGFSFPQALDAVARDADSPTAEEFARIINENRIGRDLVVAIEQTADRMASDDFRWVAEAVAIHRDTGGNLNEVLDRVGATMRERNQLREQVGALAAEGKLSAIVLMILPIALAAFYYWINAGYMAPLIGTSLGWALLGASVVLYIIGGLWMRAIVNVKF